MITKNRIRAFERVKKTGNISRYYFMSEHKRE